ncbi:MAG TPA: NfeD family protein [Thermoanaerobaculia bacterium]|nr:NfeD family protein [Thermoanaerobaculia bacterium]
MPWWIWVLFGLLLLGIELASSTLHIGLFAIGAFTVALLVGLGVEMPLWAELMTFTIVSVVAIVVIRPILVRKLGLNQKKIVDSLVGEQALALDDIAPAAIGKAEMRGTTWSARNIGETALIRGQRCVVTDIQGLVIQVRAS